MRVMSHAATALWLALLAVPHLRSPPRDGFPFSTFPMFSSGPKTAAVRVDHVVGFGPDGRGRPLGPRWLGTDEVLQAAVAVRGAIRRGASDALCTAVAQRLSASGSPLARVEVRSDEFDALRRFAGERAPLRTKVHAGCTVAPAAARGLAP